MAPLIRRAINMGLQKPTTVPSLAHLETHHEASHGVASRQSPAFALLAGRPSFSAYLSTLNATFWSRFAS